jgi:sigma-B regulation protein RsbU (phosphoserine phosphatase)
LTLAAGEGLLLYTDGVTEAFNPALEMFDEVRLEESVKAGSANAPCEIIATKLWNDLDAFVNGAPQADDITLLTLKYHGN